MDDIITTAIAFLNKIKEEKDARIMFKKKDGSDRMMNCTLDFTRIPEHDRPKDVKLNNILSMLQKNKMLRVYDTDKNAWRTVTVNTVQWMEVDNKDPKIVPTRYQVRIP